ncbi:hypothetical protein [Paenibacillus sp. FSL R7-0331]|uniref:hypothetical protein n=1 Tax=Paenibacillus sp. FSL R7-0331 TaxID=1536773 RepID=UPI0004F7BE0C|nr:hypothetical protein [Paenibacillus sp. FSL R7-0331]AIQ54362.1 hypothetical protein R70331_24410 [Paenibacillus sp. FSL R7-0331]
MVSGEQEELGEKGRPGRRSRIEKERADPGRVTESTVEIPLKWTAEARAGGINGRNPVEMGCRGWSGRN